MISCDWWNIKWYREFVFSLNCQKMHSLYVVREIIISLWWITSFVYHSTKKLP